MRRLWLLYIVVPACLIAGCDPARPLSSKERALVLPAIGCPTADGQSYRVLLNGMMFRESWAIRHQPLIEDWLDLEELIPDRIRREILRERIRPLLARRPTGRYVRVYFGQRAELIGPSGVSGLLNQEVLLSQAEAAALRAASPDGVVTLHVDVSRDNPQPTEVPVHPVAPQGLSVISDIDDTIRITEVRNTKRMISNMLMSEVRAVPGMPELYHAWASSHGADFHYLSASPYQIYPSLRLFLREQYPPGSVHMRHVTERGLKAVLSLLSTPKGYKPQAIERLIADLPGRTFVLVGDSGEHDPEVYAEMARRHPEQVRRVLIRNVSCEDAGAERYVTTFAGLPPTLWRVFNEPGEVRDAIADLAGPGS